MRFGRRTRTADELAELQAGILDLRERLAAEQYVTAELQFRLHELERRNHEIASHLRPHESENGRRRVTTPPPPKPPRSLDHLAHVAEAASDAAERNDWAIDELRTTMARLGTRLDELTMVFQTQLRDLGYEIERAAASTRTSAAVSDLALDRQVESLRVAQVRIANEQARYEIAVRTELAELADHLRRFP